MELIHNSIMTLSPIPATVTVSSSFVSHEGTRASSPLSRRIVDPLVRDREKAGTSFTMNSSDQNLLSQCNSRSGSKQSLVDSYSGQQRRLSVAATATIGSEVASAGGSYHSRRTPGQSVIYERTGTPGSERPLENLRPLPLTVSLPLQYLTAVYC